MRVVDEPARGMGETQTLLDRVGRVRGNRRLRSFGTVGLVLLARVDIDEARASRERWSFKGAQAETR